MSSDTIDQQLIYNADKCSVLMKTEIKLCLSFNIWWLVSFCIFFIAARISFVFRIVSTQCCQQVKSSQK